MRQTTRRAQSGLGRRPGVRARVARAVTRCQVSSRYRPQPAHPPPTRHGFPVPTVPSSHAMSHAPRAGELRVCAFPLFEFVSVVCGGLRVLLRGVFIYVLPHSILAEQCSRTRTWFSFRFTNWRNPPEARAPCAVSLSRQFHFADLPKAGFG